MEGRAGRGVPREAGPGVGGKAWVSNFDACCFHTL